MILYITYKPLKLLLTTPKVKVAYNLSSLQLAKHIVLLYIPDHLLIYLLFKI